ncbi:hypothetical protein XELAEV_18020267mg [Xenopus laevis]|uniref:Uncharacterized protein n=1 Tax=Xenopus laevis TaxID=8355 RepID=A0A974HQC3_XENLA|nr:hypothetical protein XELAEV_18020267mg [Xenopus laevis]
MAYSLAENTLLHYIKHECSYTEIWRKLLAHRLFPSNKAYEFVGQGYSTFVLHVAGRPYCIVNVFISLQEQELPYCIFEMLQHLVFHRPQT